MAYCLGGKFAGRFHTAIEEIHFTQGLAPAMEPNIEAMAMIGSRVVRSRHDQAIGLHRTIDLGHIATDHQPCGRGPGGFALLQKICPVKAMFQQFACGLDVSGLEELVVVEGKMDGVVEDHHIGNQVLLDLGSSGAKAFDLLGQDAERFRQGLLIRRRNYDARRRNRTHLIGNIVGRPIGLQKRQGKRQEAGQHSESFHGEIHLLKLKPLPLIRAQRRSS